MASCSSSASRSPSRRSLGTCAATRGHRLRAGGDGIAAIDLFVLPTIAFQILYCLVIVRHGRRLWVSFGVTANPTAEGISRHTVAGSPAPIRPKPSTVPANDGLRPDDRNHLKVQRQS